MTDLSAAFDGSQLRLMHVHAHPDDESSKTAATTVKYIRQGVSVRVVTCTDGSRGSILNPAVDTPEVRDNITAVRVSEMQRATEILGFEHVQLGFEDSGLPEGDPLPELPAGSFATLPPDEAAVPLVQEIRSYRPHVITCYDEKGGYPHPDHIQSHRVTVAAVRLAADPGFRPELGQPYQVAKLYYQLAFHRVRAKAINDAMIEAGLESPYADRLDGWQDYSYEHRITTQIRCGEYFGQRDDALRAHATQVDPHGHWFTVPLELQQQAYAWEDYQLVYSAVPTVIPEDDLFAGLRPGTIEPLPFTAARTM